VSFLNSQTPHGLATDGNDILCITGIYVWCKCSVSCLLQYLSLVRAVGSILELSEVTESMKSMAHVPHDERLRIVAEREQHCERIAAVLRVTKERIERKDELLQGYEKDLAKLRSAEYTVCLHLVPIYATKNTKYYFL